MNLDSLANEEEILLTSLPRAKLNNPTSEKLMYFSSDVVTLYVIKEFLFSGQWGPY